MPERDDCKPPAFNNRDPVYLQVVRHFKVEIATGRLAAGQTVPSRRELAARMKINPNTAQKAYKEMEDQGLIITEGNAPSRITTDEKVLGAIREELITEAIDTFIDSVQQIGVPMDELLEKIRSRYESKTSRNKEAST
jgi:DNA-binding transcriptional regulator YhcF (GntR family)